MKEEYGVSWSSQVTRNMSFRPEDLFSSSSVLKKHLLQACVCFPENQRDRRCIPVKLVPFLGGLWIILSGKPSYVNGVLRKLTTRGWTSNPHVYQDAEARSANAEEKQGIRQPRRLSLLCDFPTLVKKQTETGCSFLGEEQLSKPNPGSCSCVEISLRKVFFTTGVIWKFALLAKCAAKRFRKNYLELL